MQFHKSLLTATANIYVTAELWHKLVHYSSLQDFHHHLVAVPN